jgi:organic radical activating enzyme
LRQGRHVEIETNGTIGPIDFKPSMIRPAYNVSPKLKGSGNDRITYNLKSLEAFRDYPQARFKFVITNGGDFQEAKELVEIIGIPSKRVWMMPEGTDPRDLKENGELVAEWALKAGFNFTTRLHVLLWGNTRAR